MAVKVTTDEVRRTVRTMLAVLVTLAALVPVGVELGILDEQRWPWVGTLIVAAGIVTRVMQDDRVDRVLTRAGVGRAPKVVPGEVVDLELPAGDVAPAEDPAAERSAGAP